MTSLDKSVRTTCPYCGVGCGVKVTKNSDGRIMISGDEAHPANYGRLCTKGRALGDTLSEQTRIGFPHINGKLTSWSKSTAYVASQFKKIIDQHGPDAVAFYVSGQLLTEDYYVANKLMKGFIGSGNIDTNSRLCMSSPVVAQKKAFGSDTVPVCYSDLEMADLIVLIGSNLAWCHPVLFQRITEAKKQRPHLKVVVIDPKETATSLLADLHLKIISGTDLALFNGLLCFLNDFGFEGGSVKSGPLNEKAKGSENSDENKSFIPNNLKATLEAARSDYSSIEALSKTLGITSQSLTLFLKWFAQNKKVVSVFSQGINQSTMGVDQASAIINCHLLTNRIGRAGMGPFSITGQPNAMGGREVGGMATSLAAHLSFEDQEARDVLAEFWQTDQLASKPGVTAVEMFEQVASGKIKAIWIMATNPVVTLPNSQLVADALKTCPLVVVSESFSTSETAGYANVLFPATPWGEKSGTVTNAERRISRQRKFLPAFQQAKPDWWIICQVAKAMGFGKAFKFQQEAEVFKEHAKLTNIAYRKTGSLCLAPWVDIDDEQYESLSPAQWPQRSSNETSLGDIRVFGDGKFNTPDGRANMVPVSLSLRNRLAPKNKLYDDARNLFKLNSGRSRDQWHTMTRTNLAIKLNGHTAEPMVCIHPKDAIRLGIKDKSIVELENNNAKVMRRVEVSQQVNLSEVYTPMHWSKVNHSSGGINQLITNQIDPESKQPAFKQSQVQLRCLSLQSEAILVSRIELHDLNTDYWVSQKISKGYLYFISDQTTASVLFEKLSIQLKRLLGHKSKLSYFNNEEFNTERFSLIAKNNNELNGFLTVWSGDIDFDTSWLSQALIHSNYNVGLGSVFSSRPYQDSNQGSPLCLCLNINRHQIHEAAQLESNLDKVCQMTGAGKACGTCLGDIAFEIMK